MAEVSARSRRTRSAPEMALVVTICEPNPSMTVEMPPTAMTCTPQKLNVTKAAGNSKDPTDQLTDSICKKIQTI